MNRPYSPEPENTVSMRMCEPYDVIVIGGGHAGVEAALASARMGCRTMLLSMNIDTIGKMSCNPAIGGLAKGHLVREIDALGGEMGKAADMTGLQFKMLNRSKGPSVWAPRAQCDKRAYQTYVRWACERQTGLHLKQAQAINIMEESGVVSGVETDLGIRYAARCVVVTTGTFLHAKLHFGQTQLSGGRSGEASSSGLSASLGRLGIQLGRLKTGTPPRIIRRSIDFSLTEPQPGDEPVPWFSFWREDLFHVEHAGSGMPSAGETNHDYPSGSVLHRLGRQLHCHITRTTEATAGIIRANLGRSPLFSGAIQGVGPRYCPSIEDKIVRFTNRNAHQIFLEPEGVETEEIYLNGFSTSLPADIQTDLVRTIIGCEHAEITRPAYAVEYDFAFPTQLLPTLETKSMGGLFLAGQINGTSGYEEAAAQGLMAGINAARTVQGKAQLVLRRDVAYIGVLIDDLVSKGTSEPYRMFTSRAEHRLLLRQDNADVRLSGLGHENGLISRSKLDRVESKRSAVADEIHRLRTTRDGSVTLDQILRRPEVGYASLPGKNPSLPEEVALQVEFAIKYEGYIMREHESVDRLKSLESKMIPESFDYSKVAGIRSEARQKLAAIRPVTVGQAIRIPGITPADVSLIAVWLGRSEDQC